MQIFKKIIERLEEEGEKHLELSKAHELGIYEQNRQKEIACVYGHSIRIVNQVASEYGGGWIPCSERLPEYSDIHEVTAINGRGMRYIEFAYYDKPRDEWWKYDDSGLVNVRAWKEHSEPYKAESEG